MSNFPCPRLETADTADTATSPTTKAEGTMADSYASGGTDHFHSPAPPPCAPAAAPTALVSEGEMATHRDPIQQTKIWLEFWLKNSYLFHFISLICLNYPFF